MKARHPFSRRALAVARFDEWAFTCQVYAAMKIRSFPMNPCGRLQADTRTCGLVWEAAS